MAKSKHGSRSAGSEIRDYLEVQQAALVAGDAALRGGADAVHPTRVATRRMRSVLRVFEEFLDPARAQHLDEELAWFAGLLGRLRDAEVQRERLLAALGALPEDAVVGNVAARITTFLEQRSERARAALDTAMAKRRYADLLSECAAWAADPPLSRRARKKSSALEKAMDRATKKVRRTLASALATADEEELHRARKQGKRARYAAELAAPAMGRATRTRIRRFEHLQSILGEHQDAIVAMELLQRMAESVSAVPRESGFTFGVLYARELRSATKSRKKAFSAAAKL
ncbi:MAG TPA: CHAD domain-containing protein [Naasia sp.]|jgi:CHAD domain-containing protein